MSELIVGRGSERDSLREALASALAGRGTAVTISGEAGIGKTLLAQTIADDAADAGAQWVTGAGWAGGGAPAFWPWNQVLRTVVGGLDEPGLRAALGQGGPYLAHLVPQLGARLPDVAGPADLESDQERFNLFDSVLSFLLAVAVDRPLVIVLDDLHAADAPTLRLLDFVVRNLHVTPTLVLALHQESAPPEIGALLAELGRVTQHLRLRGLDRDAVADMVTRHAPQADAERLAGRIHSLTAGNPFFTAEVVRLMAEQGPGAPLRLPDGVRATIRRRLEPVSPEAVAMLEVAAVIGMEFRTETLVLATGLETGALLALMDEAVSAGVAVAGSGPDRYAFSHSLIRETLYADLVPSRRIQLHAYVGEALEHFYGEAADEHVAELSHHFLAAGSPRGAGLAERAGLRELGRLAFEPAEEHFARALEAVRETEPVSEQAVLLLIALGETRMRGGRPAEAREALVQATEIARRLSLPELFASATLTMAPWGFNIRIADTQLAALVVEALELIGEGEPALRARLLSTLARTTYWTDDLEHRVELAEQAVALARASGVDATLARVLGDAHLATWNPDGNDRSLAWTDEMLAIAARTGHRQLALDGHSWRMALLLECGDVAGVDAAFALSARQARETKEPRALALLRRHEAARALIAGDFELAERALRESAELTSSLGADEMSVMLVAALTFALGWHRGELEPLVPAIRQFADANPEFPAWRCALAGSLARTDQLGEARRELAAARGSGFAALPRDNLWLVGTALACEAIVRLGDTAAAGELAPLLAPYAGRHAVTPDGVYFGPVDGFRALLAETLGDAGEAEALRRSAREAAGRLGAAPILETLAEVGDRPGAVPPARAAALRREGDFWSVSYGADPFLLKDAKGLGHLARLLAQPEVQLHVLDLGAGGVAREQRSDDDAGPLLDAEAKAQYRQRLAELTEEIDEAESFNDPERAARAREELEFVSAELQSAVGLGGRDRKAASSAERARVNVTRQIRGAIERIAGHDEALGRHLEGTVRTGTFCVYRPEPGGPDWEIEA